MNNNTSSLWVAPAAIAIYVSSLAYGAFSKTYEPAEALAILLLFGFGLSAIAWYLAPKSVKYSTRQPPQAYEPWLLLVLLCWVVLGLVLGNQVLPFAPEAPSPAMSEVLTLLRKLLVFVAVPMACYARLYRFGWADFGLGRPALREALSGRQLALMLVLSFLVLGLNYIIGSGAKPIREGVFSAAQLSQGLPLLFAWLLLEVGLVEEFFFRALLQGRLSVWLQSERAALFLSALLFGIAHAPGMYWRGTGAIEGLGISPDLWTCLGYCIAIQSIPAFFFGIIWYKTRNLWTLMGIHAMMDVLPQFPDFVRAWGIGV